MARVLLLASASVVRAVVGWQCLSDVELGPVVQVEHKGLALDDTTFHWCPEKIPEVWPNTEQPVTSLRMFKSWRKDWPEEMRNGTWQRIVDFVYRNDAKILLGTQVTCVEEDDEQDWELTKQFLQLFQPEQIMGLAVGNEVELLFTKTSQDETVTPECIHGLWSGGGYWSKLERRARELNDLGYSDVKLTAVFTGTALGGGPFMEIPGQAMVNSFLRNATATFGERFAFSFNFYPYFDPNFRLDANGRTCTDALRRAVCWNGGDCNVPGTTVAARNKMRQLTGSDSYALWIGETGWSSPQASTLGTAMSKCKAWSSQKALKDFYGGFLQWDLQLPGARAPEHVFFFTMRDSLNFGIKEGFGLMETCDEIRCKIHSEGFTGITTTSTTTTTTTTSTTTTLTSTTTSSTTTSSTATTTVTKTTTTVTTTTSTTTTRTTTSSTSTTLTTTSSTTITNVTGAGVGADVQTGRFSLGWLWAGLAAIVLPLVGCLRLRRKRGRAGGDDCSVPTMAADLA